MNVGQLIRAWLLGPLVLLGALLLAGKIAPEPNRRFAGAQVVAIGSSLTAHALPESFTLSDGRTVHRIGIGIPSEDQLLTLLESGIDEDARSIMLEVTPFIADFAFARQQGCLAPAMELRQHLRRVRVGMVDRLRRLIGLRVSLDGMAEPTDLYLPQRNEPAVMATLYPLTIHPPCQDQRLRQAIGRAEQLGIRVDLMLLPRSPLGGAALGAVQARQLQDQARALAASVGVDLLVPAAGWSNADFTDNAHLGAKGRVRFVKILDAWLVGNE